MASLEVLPRALRAVEVGAALGGVAQLDGGHDVQHPVDLSVPAAREPVAHVVAGGGVDGCGAGPGREVVAVREPGDVADLDQQPRGAGGADAVQVQQGGAGRGDQLRSVPCSRPSCARRSARGRRPARPRPDVGSCRRRRVVARVASRALACAADRSFFAPPGISSSSRWCSWEILRVCSSPRERRRSTSSRRTASCSSLTTGRSPAIRVPTSATECASVASVLRPCPVANDPRPRGQLRRHVDDLLARGEEPASRRGDRSRCSPRSPRPGPGTG